MPGYYNYSSNYTYQLRAYNSGGNAGEASVPIGPVLPVRGMEQAALELQAIASYSVEAASVCTSGFAGVAPSVHSMLLWQETTVRSLHERMKSLSQALSAGHLFSRHAQ